MSTSTTELNRKSLKRPDEFVTTVRTVFDEIADHWRALAILAGLLLAAGLGLALYANQRNSKLELARGALFRANQALEKEMTALAVALAPPAEPEKDKTEKDKAEKTKPKPDAQSIAFKKFDVDAKLGSSVGQLKAVITSFPNTQPAQEAKQALGDLYFNHGESLKALSWYQAAVDSAHEPLDRALGLISLGYAEENAGKFSEASQNYEKALALGEEGLQGDILLGLARCQEGMKDLAKAKVTYDKIIQQLPNTEYAKTAEVLKANLE